MLVALMIFSLFGYTVYQVDRTSVNGEINLPALKAEIVEDYKDVEAEFAKGATANHKRYND
jgi:hypothetical protein